MGCYIAIVPSGTKSDPQFWNTEFLYSCYSKHHNVCVNSAHQDFAVSTTNSNSNVQHNASVGLLVVAWSNGSSVAGGDADDTRSISQYYFIISWWRNCLKVWKVQFCFHLLSGIDAILGEWAQWVELVFIEFDQLHGNHVFVILSYWHCIGPRLYQFCMICSGVVLGRVWIHWWHILEIFCCDQAKWSLLLLLHSKQWHPLWVYSAPETGIMSPDRESDQISSLVATGHMRTMLEDKHGFHGGRTHQCLHLGFGMRHTVLRIDLPQTWGTQLPLVT